MSSSPESLCRDLKEEISSVHLATLGEDGLPHTACVPFVWQNNHILIFVSQLSVHTRDLLNHPKASAMIVEDEKGCVQPFARTRLRLQCIAQRIEPGTEAYDAGLNALQNAHGNTVQVLRGLSDFVLFELVPDETIFVMGFGKAYRVTGDNMDEFEHIRSA